MRRRRKSRLSAKDKQGIQVFIALAVIVAVLLIVFVFFKSTVKSYDEASLCPDTIDRHTLILVDKSNAPTLSQSTQIAEIIEDVKKQLQTYEKLSIFILGEGRGNVQSIFSKCNPGTGEQANSLYQNPVLVQKKFDEKFGQQFDYVQDVIKHQGEADSSYIMEAIQIIANQRDFGRNVAQRHLIIISDMEQNSPWFSQYRDNSDFAAFASTEAGKSLLSDLGGVDINFYYIVRDGKFISKKKSHIQFWVDFFSMQGANSVTFRKII